MPTALQNDDFTVLEDSFEAIKTDGQRLAEGVGKLLGMLRDARRPEVEPTKRDAPATPAVDSACAELERAKRERETVLAEYHTTLAEINILEPKLDQQKLELSRLEAGIASARKEIELLRERKTQLESETANAEALAARVQTLLAKRQEADGKLEELRAMEQKVAHMAKLGEQANALLSMLWPSWLLKGELARWKEAIERQVFDASAPPSFGLLFAAIHGYNAALRDPDTKSLLDNVRDVGRRLYQWLEDTNNDQAAAASTVEAWAAAINSEATTRCTVQVAVPGNPASNQWMIFTPRGGSSPDVSTAKSWCVLDAQRRPIHRAEVTV